MTVLQERYREVSDRIGKLVLQAGREPHSVSLIAVSKTFPSDGIREVYAAGQRDFGENYIQEWYGKTEELADLTDIVWHVIGDVQSNKTKFVAERAHWVHTVCRLKTAV
ncbi:TPA: YggS family pyridoxal phosphate-dependent enzyme, partial [Neisseria gonorrhoeae]